MNYSLIVRGDFIVIKVCSIISWRDDFAGVEGEGRMRLGTGRVVGFKAGI